MEQNYDVIIVGAGAAGCVLAGRLSEVASHRVLLIEAGPEVLPGQEHADILDPFPISLANPRFVWGGLKAAVVGDSEHPFPQGYGVGGGSNVIGMVALRGVPEDYDEWRGYGVEGWDWNDVLPYFRKLEHDLDFDGPDHGTDGPIPVRRVPAQSWSAFSQSFTRAFTRRGYSLVEDLNADFREGYGPVPMNNTPDARVSTAMTYLDTSVRQRPNLTVRPEAFVERIEIEDGRAVGVLVRTAEGRKRFTGNEVIVSCGALFTPAVLQRSGVGPASLLEGLGIDVKLDAPGVGRNLQNHNDVNVATYIPRRAIQPAALRAFGQNVLRYSSKVEGCAENDMLMVLRNRGSWHRLGERIGSIGAYLYKAYSTGTVEISSADPAVQPRIKFNLLSDKRDFERLVDGLRFALELLADPEVEPWREEVFFPDTSLAFRLHQRTRWNGIRAGFIAMVLQSAKLRRRLLPVIDAGALAKDQAALEELVRQRAEPVGHVAGTCRMGAATDEDAVLDSSCRVHGLGGLRVVDASIFPTVMRGNTHLPVIMAAEKIADEIKAEWASGAHATSRDPAPTSAT